MFTFKVIPISDTDWDKYVKSCETYDFHHTSCFHKIEQSTEENPVLLVAKSPTDSICLPILIRPIPNSSYFDASSVYGYAGPIATKPFSDLPAELMAFFKTRFTDYCNSNKIISVFSRLHALIPQSDFFRNFGEVIDLNKTVAIDLSLSLDEQRQAYRKSNKSEINQLKGKKGYVFQVVHKTDFEALKSFVDIYHDTMKRVNAKPYYFFSYDYFKKLLTNTCFDCELLIAKKDGQMAAGAIFTTTSSIMQYHLAGTKEEFIQDTPMKLILDEARKMGTEKRLKYLHLGGGVGGSDEDSLFRFKSGFSKNFYQFSVWNLVLNQEVYNRLVTDKKINPSNYPNFFPLYRAVN